MGLWHINWAAQGRHTLFPDERDLVAAAGALARSEALLFCVVDDHVHGVWDWDGEPGPRSSGVSRSLGAIAKSTLQPGFRREVESRRHLETLVGYLAKQPEKHGLRVHPAAWPGSSVADQLGARLLPGFDPHRLRRLLPRWHDDPLGEAVGLAGGLNPCTDDEVVEVGWEVAARCAARALGVTDLRGNRPAVVRARRALVALAAAQPDGLRHVAAMLGVGADALRRMRTRADDEAILVVRRAIALERAVRGRRG